MQNSFKDFTIDFDLSLAAYLDSPSTSEYTVEKLSGSYDIHFDVESIGGENQTAIGSEHFHFTRLCENLKKEISEKNMDNLYYDIELPLAKVLANMEFYGIHMDTDGIKTFGKMLTEKIHSLTEDIYRLAEKEFNINSPKQLGEILFETLGLPTSKKTKTGYSTNAEVLEFLKDKHPIIEYILEYRSYTKLNSTYVEGLLKQIKDNQRIHTTYQQTETRTGRISSVEPNLQNIPVRTSLGSEMRKFFTSKEGYTLVDADYSQIELRVLAHISEDKSMTNAFLSNEDIHLNTAAEVLGLPKEMVTSQMRSSAKAINFGIVYGIGAFSLSKDINVSVKEADNYINNYLNTYSGVRMYMDDIIDFATKNGFVTTMFGRRRYLPELSSSNKNMQNFGKRIAMNTPIQGTAADIIKIAMIKVYNRLKAEKLDAYLILQVHDELIVECKDEIKDVVSKILQEEMQNATTLSVPLSVDAHTGKTWYQAKG